MTTGSVTRSICEDSADVCEAYIKKGTVNEVQVVTCSDYCSAYGLACNEMYDDHNSCNRKNAYSDCDQTGGGTSDHICVCGKRKRPTPRHPTPLHPDRTALLPTAAAEQEALAQAHQALPQASNQQGPTGKKSRALIPLK